MTNPEKLNDELLENVAGGMISQDQALQKAVQHSQVGNPDFVKHVHLDYEHGRQVYEVSFYKGRMEYEYDIDAETGAIVSFSQDYDD